MISIKKLVLITASFICFTTTIQAQPKPATLILSSKDSIQHNVRILKDPQFLDQLAPVNLVSQIENKGNTREVKFSIDSPSLVTLVYGHQFSRFYAVPEEHITVELIADEGRKRLLFTGERQNDHNFFTELEGFLKQSKVRTPFYKNDSSAASFKKEVDAYSHLKYSFLNKYHINTKLSPDFYKFASDFIRYERIFLLYKPFQAPNFNIQQLSLAYKQALDSLPVNNAALLSNPNYQNALRMKHILATYKREYIQANFDKLYGQLNKETNGKANEFMIATLLGLYYKNLKGREVSQNFIKAIDLALKETKESDYLKYLQDLHDEFSVLNKELPAFVLDNTFLIDAGSSVKQSLRQALQQSKNDSLYLDFWASWCAPCREDITNSENSRKLLAGKNVQILSLSIDKNPDLWKKAMKEDNVAGNHFLIAEGLGSELTKMLKVNYIPRYVLLDSQHRVVNMYAPRMHDKHISDLEVILNYKKPKVYTFE